MRKTKSAIDEAVHGTVKRLSDVGVIDQVTMRKFDRHCACGRSSHYSRRKQESKHIRDSTRVSQAIFAPRLDTIVSTVHKWRSTGSGRRQRPSCFTSFAPGNPQNRRT